MWEAVHRRRTSQIRKPDGSLYPYVNHPEVSRFVGRPELLVARWLWLRDEGHRRDFNFVKELECVLGDGQKFVLQDYFLYPIPEEYGNDWYRFRLEAAWPMLDGVRWISPWERDNITYEEYRMTSVYADGHADQPDIAEEEQLTPPTPEEHVKVLEDAGVDVEDLIDRCNLPPREEE